MREQRTTSANLRKEKVSDLRAQLKLLDGVAAALQERDYAIRSAQVRRADHHKINTPAFQITFDLRNPVSISIVQEPNRERWKIAERLMILSRDGIGVALSPGLHHLRVADGLRLRNEFQQQIRFALLIGQAGKNVGVLAGRFQTKNRFVSFVRATDQIVLDPELFGESVQTWSFQDQCQEPRPISRKLGFWISEQPKNFPQVGVGA